MKTPEDNNRTPMLNNGARRYWIWYLVAFLLIGGFIWLFVSNFSTGVSRSFRDEVSAAVEDRRRLYRLLPRAETGKQYGYNYHLRYAQRRPG